MSAESISNAAKIYENMLKNPANRKRSFMQQPMPSSTDLGGVKVPGAPEDTVTDADDAWIREVDQRVANKASGVASPTKATKSNITEDKRISKLEEDIKELKDLMSIIMKQHLKLMENKNG